MELLFKLMAGIVISFIVLVVYACMKVSSRCSRYEEYTLGDIEEICKDYQCDVIVGNGKVQGFARR